MILCRERSTIKQVISCVKVPYILRILKNFFLHCFPWVRIIWKGRLRYRAWVKRNVLNQEQERNVQLQLWAHSIGNSNGLFAIEKCDNLCKSFLWNLTFLTLINVTIGFNVELRCSCPALSYDLISQRSTEMSERLCFNDLLCSK